ncbi:hypothetical protein Vsou_17300 [Vulcanisaeta souniana JCM 11219]|uniref:Uncharacterized protein n=1 Tax=Vulcanisaeta souniana JCM 11219 TaxID=1293586 RepID=A0ABM8BNT6_9CREN|nr:hypothetical protein Vsou_17300 [Vulcanisaeta souniana JCM 11219]
MEISKELIKAAEERGIDLTSSPPFRAGVPRGLRGYTPLWVLLRYGGLGKTMVF